MILVVMYATEFVIFVHTLWRADSLADCEGIHTVLKICSQWLEYWKAKLKRQPLHLKTFSSHEHQLPHADCPLPYTTGPRNRDSRHQRLLMKGLLSVLHFLGAAQCVFLLSSLTGYRFQAGMQEGRTLAQALIRGFIPIQYFLFAKDMTPVSFRKSRLIQEPVSKGWGFSLYIFFLIV